MNVSRQIFISGRVQGVFFRETTRQLASQLKLAGGVRNLRDGRVEVQVSGDEKSVDSLIKWLKTGPNLAKVSNIEVLDLEVSQQDFSSSPGLSGPYFEIWPTQ